MGAHTALPTRTAGRVAGRGALTVAAALALTGGTASFAFAGTAPDSSKGADDACACDASWGHDRGDDDGWKGHDEDVKADRDDDRAKDDHQAKDDDWAKDDHKAKDDDDWAKDDHKAKADCDEPGHEGHKSWKHDDDKDGKDHHKPSSKKDGWNVGSRYERSIHNGDDNYTINNGLLSGVL